MTCAIHHSCTLSYFSPDGGLWFTGRRGNIWAWDPASGRHEEIARLQQEDVPDLELQKVKNNFAAAEYRRLTSTFGLLYQLIWYEGLGDWRETNEAGKKIQAVTAADIRRVANRYFTAPNRAVAHYTRKPGTGGDEDPDLAGLAPDQKPVVRQILASLEAESDAGKLRQALAQMEAQGAGSDPKRQQLQRIIRKKIADRIAALEAR